MSKKSLIPAVVITAIGTIFTFVILVILGIPDEFELLKMVLDAVYGALRPLTGGQFAQMMDFAYLMGLLAVLFGMVMGIVAVLAAVGVVCRWISSLR